MKGSNNKNQRRFKCTTGAASYRWCNPGQGGGTIATKWEFGKIWKGCYFFGEGLEDNTNFVIFLLTVCWNLTKVIQKKNWWTLVSKVILLITSKFGIASTKQSKELPEFLTPEMTLSTILVYVKQIPFGCELKLEISQVFVGFQVSISNL